MQQKGLRVSPVAFEVLRHHCQPALATDLPDGHHHGHHFNHGRVQHGESRLPPGRGFFLLMSVLVEFWHLSCSFFGGTILCPLTWTSTAAAAASLRRRMPLVGATWEGRLLPAVPHRPAPCGSRLQKGHGLSAGRSLRGSRVVKLRTVQWQRCPALEYKSPDSKHQLPPDQLGDFGEFLLNFHKLPFPFSKIRTDTSLPRWFSG